MTDIVTAGLDLYSSLLQADAAILALGSIFVVFRLQNASTEIEALRSKITDDENINNESEYYAWQVIGVARALLKKIKQWFQIVLAMLSAHLSLCAILLWLAPHWPFSFISLGDTISLVTIWFIVNVIGSSILIGVLLSYDLGRATRKLEKTNEELEMSVREMLERVRRNDSVRQTSK